MSSSSRRNGRQSDGPAVAYLPRLEGEGAGSEPENGGNDGEGRYRQSGPSHAHASLPRFAAHTQAVTVFLRNRASPRTQRTDEFADCIPRVLDPVLPSALLSSGVWLMRDPTSGSHPDVTVITVFLASTATPD